MKSQRYKTFQPQRGRKNRPITFWNTNTKRDSHEVLLDRGQKCTRYGKRAKFKSYQSIVLLFSLFLIISLIFYILRRTPDGCVYKKTEERSDSTVYTNEMISEQDSYDKIIPEIGLGVSDTRNYEKPNAISNRDRIVFRKFSEDKRQCPPIHNNVTKTMRKSLQKCLEYQRRYVYPCRESATPNEGMVRLNHCNWRPEGLIINGENAYLGEFPHMVLLGFNTADEDTKWKCGGVLISEKFVLTAGHCTSTAARNQVRYVRIGIQNKTEKIHDTNMYNVQKIHKHKQYKSPSRYHDIALLETDRVMKLHRYAVPACLHDGSFINDLEVVSTGWGTIVSNEESFPDTLQKVTLERFTKKECALNYQRARYLKNGYDEITQICYGDKYTTRDTCKGDSGGPTQIKHPQVKCMYLITSITSNGKRCGVTGTPGLYTRVAPYLDWIESIVWPS
ncbi:unnamed protein product, partial [Brenthis ino]